MKSHNIQVFTTIPTALIDLCREFLTLLEAHNLGLTFSINRKSLLNDPKKIYLYFQEGVRKLQEETRCDISSLELKKSKLIILLGAGKLTYEECNNLSYINFESSDIDAILKDTISFKEFNEYYGHPILTQYLLQDRKNGIITEDKFQEYMSLDTFSVSGKKKDELILLSKVYNHKYGVKILNDYFKYDEILESIYKSRDTEKDYPSSFVKSLNVIFSEHGLRILSLKKNPLTQQQYVDMTPNQREYLKNILNHYGTQAIETEIISLADYLGMDDQQRIDLCYLLNNFGFKALLKKLINLQLFLRASSFARHNLDFLFNSYGLQSLEEKDVDIEEFLSLKPPYEIEGRKVTNTNMHSNDSLVEFLNLQYGRKNVDLLYSNITLQQYANDYFSFKILFSAFGLQLLKLIDFKTYVAASYWPRCELGIFSSETGLKFLQTIYSLDKFLKIDFNTERTEKLLSKIFNEFGMKIMLLGFITPDEIYSATPEFRSEILELFTPFGFKIIESGLFSFKEFSALKSHARKDLLKLLTPHGVPALLKHDITLGLLNSDIFSKCKTDCLFTAYGLLFAAKKLLSYQEYANYYSVLLENSPDCYPSQGNVKIFEGNLLALFNPLGFEICKAKKMSIKDWVSSEGILFLHRLYKVSKSDAEMVNLIKNHLISSQSIVNYFYDDKLRETLRLTLDKNGYYMLRDWLTNKPLATDPVLLRKIASVKIIQTIQDKKLTLEEIVLNHSAEEKMVENNFSSLFRARPYLKVWNLAEGEEKISNDCSFNCTISFDQLSNYLTDVRQLLNNLPEFSQNISVFFTAKVKAAYYNDKVMLEKELKFYQDEIKKIPSSKNIIHILKSIVIKLNAFKKLIEPVGKDSGSSRYYNAFKVFFSIGVKSAVSYWPDSITDLVYILKNRPDLHHLKLGANNQNKVTERPRIY